MARIKKTQKSKTRKYWFKRRRYGWGWMPVTWQGWLAIGVFTAVVISAAYQFGTEPAPASNDLLRFFASIVGAVVGMLLLGYLTGPEPRWRWGKKSSDNTDEDY